LTIAPLLALNGVGKLYPNGVEPLVALDLAVEEGETLTLLGPSGCGKSTTLRLIAGLTRPTRGEISWRVEPRPGEIGFVFQEPTLMPWADVAANVALPLKLQNAPAAAIATRVGEALAQVGLSRFQGALPRELSGGMKMRVAIARALVTRPKLLLMDEPFAALDEVTRFKLNDDLLALKRDRGVTIVFVTHSVYESVYLSTRVVTLAARGGAIVDSFDVRPTQARDAAFRLSVEFAQYAHRAAEALQRAMGEAAP
jgi:NitT/TauT family transport system ATP-binding protein